MFYAPHQTELRFHLRNLIGAISCSIAHKDALNFSVIEGVNSKSLNITRDQLVIYKLCAYSLNIPCELARQ